MPSAQDLTEGSIMREVGTKTASVKMPLRILNALGEINACCVMSNDDGRIKRLKSVAQLAASIDTMKSGEAAAKKTKATEDLEALLTHTAKGMAKLRTDFSKVCPPARRHDVSRAPPADPLHFYMNIVIFTCLDHIQIAELTGNELKGIAYKYMKRTIKGKSKAHLVDAFAAAVAGTGWKLRTFNQRACPDTGQGTVFHQEVGSTFTAWKLPEDGEVVPNNDWLPATLFWGRGVPARGSFK